jgi:anti-anti-sigma factor
MFKLELEYKNGILFARLKGILNRKNSYKINNYLVPVILKHKIKYLVYNFYNLEDIDEDGIDALLNSEEAIKTNKGVMYICEVNKRLERKLKHFRARKFDNELTCMKLIEV